MSVEHVEITVGGTPVAVRVFQPIQKSMNGAAVILVQGLSATMDSGLGPFIDRFVDSGLIAITFDYRHFGLSGGKPRQFISVSRQLADIQAVLAYARCRPDIDGQRVVLWSSSFGGGLGVHVAVNDGQIRALVAQCPMLDRRRATKMGFAGRTSGQNTRIKFLALWAYIVSFFGFRGPVLPVTDPSRFAVIPTDESQLFHTLKGPQWRNELALISFLRGGLHLNDALKVADKLETPTLIQICDRDQTISNVGIREFIGKAGDCVTSTSYDCGHFDIYLPPFVEPAASEAAAFFLSQLAS